MEVSLVFLILCATLGFLSFLYVLEFRRRALMLGMEGLRSAMARLVGSEGPACEEALREGTLNLISRFNRALILVGAALTLFASSCVALVFLSLWPEVRLVLCGLCSLLSSVLLSLLALRKLPLLLLSDLEEVKGSSRGGKG